MGLLHLRRKRAGLGLHLRGLCGVGTCGEVNDSLLSLAFYCFFLISLECMELRVSNGLVRDEVPCSGFAISIGQPHNKTRCTQISHWKETQAAELVTPAQTTCTFQSSILLPLAPINIDTCVRSTYTYVHHKSGCLR